MQASSLIPNLRKFGPRKNSFLDKILRGPLGKVRAYKVQAPPSNRNTSWDHVAANRSPPAYPLYFVSHRLTVFLCSEPFQNCTNTNIEEAQNRHNFDFKLTENRCLCFKKWIFCFGWVSKLVQWGGVEIQDGGRGPTPLNPFWKRGEINFIWPNFKLERSHWQQCPIHSWFDSAEKEWVIWPWKITYSQIALDSSVCV